MPKFFDDEATRLIRKYWGDDAEALAEELFAMWKRKSQEQQQGPMTLTRSGDEPALRIIDNGSGDTSPIQVIKNNDGDAGAVDPGDGGKCCGGGGGGVGSGKPDDPNDPFPEPNFPQGTVNEDKRNVLPDPNMPRKRFSGEVEIEIIQGAPDTYGFNGKRPAFSAGGCCAYKPDKGVKGPTSGFTSCLNEPDTISNQIVKFMQKWNLDGYKVISDTVTGPGADCV